MAQRAPTGRILAGAFVVVAALASLAWAWLASAERELRGRVEARLKELTREIEERDPRRPPILGDPLPGDAWDDYERALALCEEIPKETRDVLRAYAHKQSHDADAARHALGVAAPVLEALERGARRSEARYPGDWRSHRGKEWAWRANGLSLLSWAARAGARISFEEGFSEEGVRHLLALTQLSRDLEVYDTHDRGVLPRPSLRGALDQELSMDAARLLARGLETLEGQLPTLRDRVRFELKGWARVVLAGGQGNRLAAKAPFPSWRQAFSPTLMELTGFLNVDEWFQSGAAADDLSWKEAAALWDGLERTSWTRGNPASQGVPFIYDAPRRQRDSLARLRLQRMAARYLASGTLEPLADPYGDVLRHAFEGDTLKLWSMGRNGVDDGGSESPRHTGDLVLRVRR